MNGGPSVALANGNAAAARTITIIAESAAHAGSPRIVASAAGAPAAVIAPPASATPPAAIAGATIGTTRRFTSGAMIGTRPNQASAIGRVANSAASETPSDSQSQPGSSPPRQALRRSVSGVAHAMSPPVAAADRAKPGSVTSVGAAMTSPTMAQPSAAAARPLRPVSRASRTTVAMTAARSTDEDAPVRIV